MVDLDEIDPKLAIVAFLLISLVLAYTFQNIILKPAAVVSLSPVGVSLVPSSDPNYKQIKGGYFVITQTIDYERWYGFKFSQENITSSGITWDGKPVVIEGTLELTTIPLKPYITIDLMKHSDAAAAVLVPPCTGDKITGVSQIQLVLGILTPLDCRTTDMATLPLTLNYYAPGNLPAPKLYTPFQIQLKWNSGSASSAGPQSQVGGETSASTFTFNPTGPSEWWTIQTPNGEIRVQNLGLLQGQQMLPEGMGTLVFMPYSNIFSVADASGAKYIVYKAIEDKLNYGTPEAIKTSSYAYYWIGNTAKGDAISLWATQPNEIFPYTSPGWAWEKVAAFGGYQVQVHYPLQPLLDGFQESKSIHQDLDWPYYADIAQKSGMGFFQWLDSQYGGQRIQGDIGYLKNWKLIDLTTGPKLYAEMPFTIYKQMVSIWIPTEMVNALVYDPIVSDFKIVNKDASGFVPFTTFTAGQDGTLSVRIRNTGNQKAEALISVEASTFSVFPSSDRILLSPNEERTVTFTVRVGVQSSEQAKVMVKDSWNKITDTASVNFKSQAPVAKVVFSFIGMNPAKIPPKGSATITIGVTNQGGTQTQCKVKVSGVNGPYTINPMEQSLTIEAGAEKRTTFTVTSTSDTGTGSIQFDLYDAYGNKVGSTIVSIETSQQGEQEDIELIKVLALLATFKILAIIAGSAAALLIYLAIQTGQKLFFTLGCTVMLLALALIFSPELFLVLRGIFAAWNIKLSLEYFFAVVAVGLVSAGLLAYAIFGRDED